MSIAKKFERVLKGFLPAPFTIAVILTLFTLLLAFFITEPKSEGSHILQLLTYWEEGIWHPPLLVFAIQMMLMLVLGHVLALTKPVNSLIEKGAIYCNNTANAAGIITFFTLLVSLFNWGLGLIFGAIFARKVGEQASKKGIQLNYPLIGAAGYSGLMVWHGGISGSAPIKIAEEGHFLADKIGVISQAETVFSAMNISVSILLLIILPLLMYFIGKRNNGTSISLKTNNQQQKIIISGAEKIDHSKLMAFFFGGLIITFAFYKAIILPENISLKIITPNYINLVLLGLGIMMHSSFL